MPPTTAERVPVNTSDAVNRRIEDAAAGRVRHLAANPSQIPRRLKELDAEWDIERALEANASALMVFGALRSLTHGRQWIVLPALVGGFLFQHAIMGWCPPLPVLRRLGFRTPGEIDRERQALKALRGDFRGLDRNAEASPRRQAAAALKAARV